MNSSSRTDLDRVEGDTPGIIAKLEKAMAGYVRTLQPAWTGDNYDARLLMVDALADNFPAIIAALRQGEEAERLLGICRRLRWDQQADGRVVASATDAGSLNAQQDLCGFLFDEALSSMTSAEGVAAQVTAKSPGETQ